MKKVLSALFFLSLVLVTPVKAAIMEVDGIATEVGSLDDLVLSGNLGPRFDDQVRSLEAFLGLTTDSLDMEEIPLVDGIDNITGHIWTQTFSATDSFLTFDFGADSSSIYYMLSLSSDSDIHRQYFFDNNDDLQFAYISLNNMFSYDGNQPYDAITNTAGNFDFKISRVTHVSTVPEPTLISLFGAGLIGFGLARRKRVNK